MDSKIVESKIELVRSQFALGYIMSYNSNLERLETVIQNLEDTKSGVQHSVDKAKRNGEKIENIVQIWLKKVDATVAEANNLIDNDVLAKDKYYMRYFPNLRFRHQQSKKSQKMTQEIHKVLAEGNFERISYYKPSRLEEIQQVLKDPNIYMIGLYGIDGVGKTTLVKDLAWQVEKEGLFDAVVMADITDAPDVQNIPGQIANVLSLKFDEEAKEGRVEQLRQRIRKEKNIVVILDDISEKLDLAELEIPFGDEHKGCKLLLTSKNLSVLKRQMGTQKDFRLEVLSEEDSLNLFAKFVGNVIETFYIKPIAPDVAKCCNGLPLLIVILAKALRKKNSSTWKNALNQLKGLDEQGLFKEVVCPLELSYYYLETDELKTLFVFIASFGLDRIHRGELFSSYWGLMGLHRDLNTLTEARNKYYKLINDLRASSLLLEGEIEFVRMHAVVRDMAKAIASRSHPIYEVQKFTQMEQWDIDQLQKCHYINLPSYNIDELPEKLDCPELKLMSLRRNFGYLTIPDDFFSGMGKVKVLNLHGMKFTPRPHSSLGLLTTNLISLNLYGCVLKDVALVAELKSLEILNLERSEIQELPKEIGQLVHLRMLNLTNCYQLKTIPTNLLSRLTRLEELYMGNCNIQWEIEGGKSQTNNASLGELRNLNQLTTLDLSIQDASVLPSDDYVFARLQRYKIFIGNMWKWSGDGREASRTLKLADSLNTNFCLDHGVQKLFPTVEDLSLAKLNLVNDVFYKLNGKTFPQLRHLHIQNSDAFRNLETLILRDLHNMEDMCYSPLPTHSFEKLKVIKVQGCDKLKKLLLHSLTKNLSQLHEMEISDCKVMEEIIYEEKLEDEKEFPKIMLPNLHSLTLDGLSMLRSFSLPLTADKYDLSIPLALFNQKVARALVKLQHLRVANCPKLKDIFVQEEKDTFPNLETLVVSDNDNLKSIWPNLLAPNSFCKLKELQISGTKTMDHVFPISVVEELRQLQVLVISKCRIENIVEKSVSCDVKRVSCMYHGVID